MRPPKAHRVKKPFKYVSAAETNIAETIRRVREQQASNAAEAKAKVEQLRRKA